MFLLFFSSGYWWTVLPLHISIAFSQLKADDSGMEFIIPESLIP